VTEQLDPFARPDHGALFVVSGPSGAGKTTLVHRLLAHFPDMKFSVSATTRSPRSGEVAGKDYHFLTPQEFETKIAARAFLEHATVYGHRYGTLAEPVHQALAARNSRLALYDLRDSLLEPDRLPVAFLAALEEIGDETCLETLAAAYEASSRSGDAWWREHVAAAFRAIMQREGLTRRHAAVKRAMARWPDAAADLIGRG
jgi:hypothetical protein